MLIFTLLIFVRVFQNCDVNNLLRSEMMLSGILFPQYHLLKKTLANRSAVIWVVVGIICMSAPRRSVMVSIQSKPSSIGGGPMKSMATLDPYASGTGNGCNGPGVSLCGVGFAGTPYRKECKISSQVWPNGSN
jgi:hypothetical protein